MKAISKFFFANSIKKLVLLALILICNSALASTKMPVETKMHFVKQAAPKVENVDIGGGRPPIIIDVFTSEEIGNQGAPRVPFPPVKATLDVQSNLPIGGYERPKPQFPSVGCRNNVSLRL